MFKPTKLGWLYENRGRDCRGHIGNGVTVTEEAIACKRSGNCDWREQGYAPVSVPHDRFVPKEHCSGVIMKEGENEPATAN